MSSELHKYIETSIKKKGNLLNADVINFPNDKKLDESQHHNLNFWNIRDKSNIDQFRAIIGVCFMFVALILMGIYSNFI